MKKTVKLSLAILSAMLITLSSFAQIKERASASFAGKKNGSITLSELKEKVVSSNPNFTIISMKVGFKENNGVLDLFKINGDKLNEQALTFLQGYKSKATANQTSTPANLFVKEIQAKDADCKMVILSDLMFIVDFEQDKK